jgi:hypothetical protein
MTQEELQQRMDMLVRSGMPHQQVYDELNQAYPGRELDSAALLAELPSLKQRSRYKGVHGVFVGLIFVGFVFQIWGTLWGFSRFEAIGLTFAIILPLSYGLMTWLVIRWRTSGHNLMGYVSLCIMVWFLILAATDNFGPLWLSAMGLHFVIAGFGFFLRSKIGGKYTKTFVGHVDSSQGKLARYTIRFVNE